MIKIEPSEKMAVYVAGLKSAIILHELRKQTDDPIHTYSYGFPNDNQFDQARRIAKHYNATPLIHVRIHELLPWYKKVQSYFHSHVLNICPFFLAQAASDNRMINCYVGEGIHEHVYQVLHKAFGLNLHIARFGASREALINQYQDEVPSQILGLIQRNPWPNPYMLWQRELYRVYPDESPQTQKQIWALLENYAEEQMPPKEKGCGC